MTLPNTLKYNHIFYSFLAFLLYTTSYVQAQVLNNTIVQQYDSIFKSAHGVDQNLINGYQYINSYPNAKGHAFFNKDEFLQGKININNKEYNKVDLKYDVYGQKVLLKYKTSNGGSNQIELHNHLISHFELYNKIFKHLSFPEIGNSCFQVISDSLIKCYYLWYKNIGRSSGSLDNYFVFSDQKKNTYLLINEELHQYKGNRSFVKLFPKNQQNTIKQYIRDHKIKLKKVSDLKVKELIYYCEKLIIEG